MLATALVVTIALPCLPALAGAGDDVGAALRDGDRSLRACDVARALVKYRALYDRTQHASALLSMGDALRMMGRLVRAAEAYERYLSHTGSDPEKRPEVEKKLGEIDRQVGRLRLQPGARGRIRVDGSDVGEGAEVRVRVDPGPHAVTLEQGDALLAAEAVQVGPGEERVVTFGAAAAPPPPAPPPPDRSATGSVARTADALKKACKLLEAVDAYRSAQETAPKGRVARHLGDTLERAGRPAEAADAYDDSLRLGRDPSGKTQAQARLAALDGQIDRVRFEPVAPGATLRVDGRAVAVRPDGFVRLEPGAHAALLEVDGRVQAAATLNASPGGQTTVTLRPLSPASAPAVPAALVAGPAAPVPAPPAVPVIAGGTPGAAAAAAAPALPETAGDDAKAGSAGGSSSDAEPEAEESSGRSWSPADEPQGHDGQISAVGLAEVDVRTGDAGPTAGIAMGIGSRLELAFLLLRQRLGGARIACSLLLLPEPALKPFVRAGATFFDQDGTRTGAHAAAGLFWDFLPVLGVSADASLEHFPNMPAPYHKTYVLLSAGVQLRTPR